MTVQKTTALGFFIATGLLCSSALPSSAGQWVARHGLSSVQYQQSFDDFVNSGYCLKSVSGYQQGNRARYTGVWSKDNCKPFQARHGLTPNQYQSVFNDLTQKGYRLTYVNGYSVGNQPYYSAIWEKSSGPAYIARHGLTESQYLNQKKVYAKQGFRPVHVSAFTVGSLPRFAAIFQKGVSGSFTRHDMTSAKYQQLFNKASKKGYRVKVVSGYRKGGQDRYVAIFTKRPGVNSSWQARHGVPSGQYQQVFDGIIANNLQPAYVEGFNSSKGVRFNGVWAK